MSLKSYLADAVAGATLTAQTITWTDDDGTAKNLAGATITGRIVPQGSGAARAATGVMALVGGGTTGQFTWTYSAADVVTAGKCYVQFKATIGAVYDLSKKVEWVVLEAV